MWTWSTDCQRAFELIKAKIAAPPTLAHFDTAADETLVTCDASAVALGACLSQKINGVERLVAFASRVLSSAERNYSASEREALACLWACERWHFTSMAAASLSSPIIRHYIRCLQQGVRAIGRYVCIGGVIGFTSIHLTCSTSLDVRTGSLFVPLVQRGELNVSSRCRRRTVR